MRIVKLSDLSEEDKKRIQERQIQNLRTNRQNRIEANKKFNELINQKGEFDTSRHTSTVGRLQKAYKNNETVKKSLDGYYKNNTTSLWKGTQNFADATGKIGENTYKGAENGILSSIQNLGRNMFNLQGRKEEENIFDKVNKQILDSRKDLSSEERTSIIDKMNNSSFSQKNLIKGIEEKNQKFQEKKNENTLKIQQNADSISNPVGKYIAGEIAPGIGQMLPGMLPGIGTTYFISSATGNYHDDAIQRGMTEDQATIYSGTMGIIEGALESLGANLTKNVGKQLLKKNIKGALVNYGLDIGENFLEESIVEPISEIAAQVYGGKDKADWSSVGQRMIESGVAGALTSAITGGASAMIGGIGSKVNQQNQYVDYNTNKKLNKDSQNWLKQAENIIQENSTPKLSPQLVQNQQNTTVQQITPTIQNNVQNGISEQKNNLNDNAVNENSTNQKLQKALEKNGDFSTQVDKYIKGELPSGDLLYLGNTSKTLQKLGLKNEPLILKQSKLKSMLEYSNNNDRLHGLPAETIKKIPEAINNPLNILKSSTHDNSIVVITDLADSSSRPIIASIEIDYNGQIGDIDFLSNRLTSAYGKNNYDRFMQTEIAKGNLLYDIDEGILKELPATGLQLSKGISSFDESSSFINNSIPQNENSVKDNTITNNYMQNAENNSDSLKAPVNTSNTQVQENSKTLNVKTMWKKPTTLTNNQQIPSSTPKATDSSISSTTNTIISQDNQNMQVQQEKVKAPISGDVKARKHYKSIMESQYTSNEAKAISKELMGTDTYVPDSNNSQLERANERILNSTPESELKSFMSKVMNGEKITATDIAVGEKLIQYYSKAGDKGKLQDAIQATAMAGTSAGQTVQALSLLNHQTPEGQAIWLQRSVDKMNNDLKKTRGANAEQFNLTEDMINKIVDSKNNEELQNNLNDVYKELGQQVSKTNLQKIDAWRYFAMLANPKTHIRNIVGNTAMAGVQGIKNKVAGAIEGTVSKVNPNMERNHTIVSASKEVTTFAKNDIKNVADRLGLNENKYNPKTRLENSMRTFKSDTLENTIGKLFDLNDNLLEAEDGWGLKAGYTKALSEYMTANNLNPDTITDKQLAKARNYAVEQAQEATFHQASAISSSLNQLQNKKGLTKKFLMDSILPFKKTPINVAKAGLEYSPAGLAKSLIYDTVNLRKGNITVNKYIDNISKGLTGTGIALLGYALADAGILKASGSDDKDKEKYDEEMGKQTYSITIAGNTYSLDWLAPTGIPLFIGAECHEIMQTDKEEKTSSSDEDSRYNQAIKTATNILDSFTNAMNPMTEMSMLSGLTSALKSYDQGGSKMIATFGTNAVKSYVNQFVPTAVGQIARTTDEYERNTTSTKTGPLPKAIDTTKNQIMNKIPGLRQMLPIKTDIWGNQVKQSENVIQRGLENSVFPWTRKEVSTSKVDNELTRLYDETGESTILPDTLSKKLTINGQDYRLTNEEYAKYKTSYGKTSYNLLNDLVSSSEYKNMSSSQKQTAIESIYDYAKEKNKVDYADKVKETIETSTNYNILEELKRSGGNQTQYLNYLSKTREIQGEKANQKKNQLLLDANYSSKTKSIIYQNTTGKDDKVYQILKKLDSNKNIINQYLDYLQADLEADREDDGTEKGKAISGTKKKKVSNYINSIDSKDMSYVQRLYLAGINTTLSTSEKKKLFTYINENKSLTSKEKMEALDKLQGFTVYKNGKVTW